MEQNAQIKHKPGNTVAQHATVGHFFIEADITNH
jgi:hypothetical protein